MSTQITQNVKKVDSAVVTKNKADISVKIDSVLHPIMSLTAMNENQAKQYLMMFKLNIEKARETTPESVMKALFLCASSGLSPDPTFGEVYFIPRKNKNKQGCPSELNFQIGYKGFRSLVRKTDEVLSIDSYTVFENDEFSADYTYTYEFCGNVIIKKQPLRHIPAVGKRGQISGFYCTATLRPSPDMIVERVLYLTREQVEEYRDSYTDSRDREGNITGAWVDSFEAMGKKVPISMLCKDLPMNSKVATILESEDLISQENLSSIIEQKAIQAGFLEAKPEVLPEMKSAKKNTAKEVLTPEPEITVTASDVERIIEEVEESHMTAAELKAKEEKLNTQTPLETRQEISETANIVINQSDKEIAQDITMTTEERANLIVQKSKYNSQR